MDGSFEFWTTIEYYFEDRHGSIETDVCLTGHYFISEGRKATRYEPEEYPEIDYADLEIEVCDEQGQVTIITDDSTIDNLVDWQDVEEEVLSKAVANERDARDYAADLLMDQIREEGFI